MARQSTRIAYASAAVVLVAAVYLAANPPWGRNEAKPAGNGPAAAQQGESLADLPPIAGTMPIRGFSPRDVYEPLEAFGYTIVKELEGDPKVWKCRQAKDGHTRSLEITGPSKVQVSVVAAATLNVGEGDSNEVARGLFLELAALPIEGAPPGDVQAWVDENLGETVSKSFAGVKIELFAPTSRCRMLRISAE